MNYALTYSKLIAKAKARVCVDGYVERHHILPKALGGSDDSSNLVALTAREHFVAHFNSMTLGRKASYEERLRMSLIRKGKAGKSVSEETKNKLSVINTGKKLTEESKAKISASQKGLKKPDGHGAKISAFLKGKPRTEEVKRKVSESLKAFHAAKRLAKDAISAAKTPSTHGVEKLGVKSLETS